jgi:hypothetical protein
VITDYEEAKSKLKSLHSQGRISTKDYYRLVSQLRARFLSAPKIFDVLADDVVSDPMKVFDGKV